MASRLKTTADQIVSTLNAHTFSMAFTASRSILPEESLISAGDTLTVVVISKAIPESELAARAYLQEQVQTDIAVFKRLPGFTTAQVDAMLQLVQEIRDYLNSLAVRKTLAVTKVENPTIYSPDHLREKQQFFSVVTVTQEVTEACSA